MSKARVLKLNRSDSASAHVLIEATPQGSKPLDLKLVATEGVGIFVASLKDDRVNSLRVKNCPASEDEWHSILQSLFTQEPHPDIEATATVETESLLSITIRKRLQGITQRLGSVDLTYEYREIELFDWCAIAADAAATNRKAAHALENRVSEQDGIIAELKAQLDELVRAKEEDETALLRNARDLINEKKVKIREYHKIIEATRSSIKNSSTPEPQLPSNPVAHRPKESRPRKRKAKALASLGKEEDGVEAMDVDSVKSEQDQTESGHVTDATVSVADDSDAGGGADNDDDDDDDDDDVPTSDARTFNVKESTKQAVRTKAQQGQPKKALHEPPPRRDLPFTKIKPTKAPPAPAAGGSETESDDEL
ncbi:hypothetical protein S7711_06600 [Stachybotrys chartarum IBT 7711]|uniref:Uncharacterized protein n=1 Tax=Stachybotrys chartarum (strain CBS 109288 / IBT 7711) TaxID=1280523 RepID=A0A084AYQ6_STACB|nr:hypothetical protein S7711_06600 [Stachybotrys chartarum IBT 7711]